MKKNYKRAAVAVGSIVALLLAVMWVIPPVARHYINENGEQLCGRKLYVDDIDLNLFAGSLTVDSVNIFEPDGNTPFVQVRQLYVNVGLWRLLTGMINVEQIEVDRLQVDVTQRDTVFNFSDILQFFDSGETAPEEAESDPLRVLIDRIHLSDSYVRYRDLVVGSDIRLKDIDATIQNIDLQQLQPSVDVALAFADGGQLKSHVDYDDPKGDFRVKLNLHGFNLHGVLPYLQQSMYASDLKGRLDADMNVSGNLNHILALQVDGQTCVRSFLLADKSGAPCVAADSLSLATSEVNLLKNRYGISYIYLKDPDIHVVMGKDSIDNITRMLTTAIIDQQDEEEPSVAADSLLLTDSVAPRVDDEPFDLYINHLLVSNGQAHYIDSTLTYDPFVYEVGDINFESKDFTLSGINDITIGCRPGSGEGSIDVTYHGCFEDMHNMLVNLDVKGVELKDFSPYVVQMFGNPMTGGTLSFSSDTKVEQGNLDSKNHLIIRKPVVEDKRKDVKPEIKGVPLKAGIYILTDKNGVCDMEIPVTGNIDEPKFSVKRLIFRTLGKLIVKVAASPFGGGSSTTPSGETASPSPAETAAPSPAVADPTAAAVSNETPSTSVTEP